MATWAENYTSPDDEEISKRAAKDALRMFDPEVARQHGWVSPEEYSRALLAADGLIKEYAEKTRSIKSNEAELTKRAETAERKLNELHRSLRVLLPPNSGGEVKCICGWTGNKEDWEKAMRTPPHYVCPSGNLGAHKLI